MPEGDDGKRPTREACRKSSPRSSHFLLLFAMANFAIATNRHFTEARRELRSQAWQLQQLLPKIGQERGREREVK